MACVASSTTEAAPPQLGAAQHAVACRVSRARRDMTRGRVRDLCASETTGREGPESALRPEIVPLAAIPLGRPRGAGGGEPGCGGELSAVIAMSW